MPLNEEDLNAIRQIVTGAIEASETRTSAVIERSIQASETRTSAVIERAIQASETRTSAAIERVETSLLTAFHKWSSPLEQRMRTHKEVMRAFDLELEGITDRVTKLEPKH